MELYDYLWLPENKSNTGCFRQKIQFGETAVADKIARRTMPYLAALGVTPDMTGYYMLSRAVALFIIGGRQESIPVTILPKIAVDTALTTLFVERSCEAAVHYTWHNGKMTLSAGHSDADLLHFTEMPSIVLLIERLAQAVLRNYGDEFKA